MRRIAVTLSVVVALAALTGCSRTMHETTAASPATTAPSSTTVVVTPGTTTVVQAPAPVTTPWCGGAYAPVGGTNFGGCPSTAR